MSFKNNALFSMFSSLVATSLKTVSLNAGSLKTGSLATAAQINPSLILSSLLILSLSGCSNSAVNTAGEGYSQQTIAPDTFESLNRKIFTFNDTVDQLLLKPVAKAYKAITPEPINKNVGNFFGNLGDVSNAINNVLQFKFKDALTDTERFVINSTIGFAGLVDIASATGLEKHDEDFGQTLAAWGVPSGPYVMLPFLGPSTVRDGASKLTVERVFDASNYMDENVSLFALKLLKKRSDLFADEKLLETMSDDKYSALRDIWLQQRNALINDGKVTSDTDTSTDLIDELESLDLE